jgi:SAM-dependent methyltransferase
MAGTYDRIARFYDVDMAQNMRFDDVAFYAHHCERQRGTVLELGCGNGRVLLPLLARGIDAIGVDASAPMLGELAKKSRARGIAVRAVRADVRRLPFRFEFAAILCPYSLVTYMTSEAELDRLVGGARALMPARGMLVLDAFVPRVLPPPQEFVHDYTRPFGAFALARWKRIVPAGGGANRVERRYRLCAHDGRVVESVDVAETIHPWTPDALRDAVTRAGLAHVGEAWDYGTRPGATDAQFYTLIARAA